VVDARDWNRSAYRRIGRALADDAQRPRCTGRSGCYREGQPLEDGSCAFHETQAYVAKILGLLGGAGEGSAPLEVRLVA
jgi:hypothetical protein